MKTLIKEQRVQPIKFQETTESFEQALGEALEDIGSRFGIYKVMAQTGPITPVCLATQAGISLESARVWLDAQSTRKRLRSSPSIDLYCVERSPFTIS